MYYNDTHAICAIQPLEALLQSLSQPSQCSIYSSASIKRLEDLGHGLVGELDS